MARPPKEGCSYFPLDCDFFNDRKVRLLRAVYGGKAEAVLIRLWCMIYAGAGWWLHLDTDEIALLAESMGGGFSPEYIRDVVLAACERGLFDKDIFARWQVLTSDGVQKRYLEIKCRKSSIPVIHEYWVLPESYFEGENAALLLKLHFYSVSAETTAVFTEKTQVNSETTTQSKVNESKPKKRKAEGARRSARDAPPDRLREIFAASAKEDGALLQRMLDFACNRKELGKPLTETAAARLCAKLQRLAADAGVQDRSRYMQQVLDESIANGWQGVFPLKEFVDRDVAHQGVGGDRPREIAAGADIMQFL